MNARTRMWRATSRGAGSAGAQNGAYRHSEGNSDSHVKSVLVGGSQILFVEDSRLALGRWQGIFFCEFDGPRERKLIVKTVAD
jgi:secondary thiamine-phosphate synthase enzyme